LDQADAPDSAENSETIASLADRTLSSIQSASSVRRSPLSFADGQERVLEAFWQDTRPSAAPPPVPYRELLESLQSATAALSTEREDIAASQRLAERFARQPAQAPMPPARPQAPAIRPYMVAAAFMILAAGGSAFYFLASGTSSKRAPDGPVQAA